MERLSILRAEAFPAAERTERINPCPFASRTYRFMNNPDQKFLLAWLLEPADQDVLALHFDLISGDGVPAGMIGKTRSHVESPAMPGAGDHAAREASACQRPAHVRADGIHRIKMAFHVAQGDGLVMNQNVPDRPLGDLFGSRDFNKR